MTGPTQPADDLRARIAASLQRSFVGAEMDRRDTEAVDLTAHDTEKAADRLLAAVVEPELARLRDEATEAHARNLALRDEHRRERITLTRLMLAANDAWSPHAADLDSQVEAAETAIRGARDTATSMEAEPWHLMRHQRDQARARLRGMARKVVATRAELHEAVEDWAENDAQVLADSAKLAEENQRLAAEVDRLNLEIQGYQVGDPYQRGHEHGVQAALARLSGGNTPADAADLATIDERDAAEEWADRLAYAIAPESVIGVHSSGSNPWAHALNLIEAERAASVPDVADSRKRVFVVDAKSGLRTAMRPGRPVRVQFRVDTDPAVATPARAYGLVDVVPAGVDGVIGARSKRTWYRRPEGWLALERPGDPVRLVSEHSLFVLEGSVSPAPSVGADPEDEVLAELREDERQHAELNPKLAAPPAAVADTAHERTKPDA